MSQKVNLNAYFERIGFAGSIAPTLATLEAIAALHPAAIPFESLDPLMGRAVPLDQASLEQKLLHDRRGGYCFEHNTLLANVLRDLDYTVTAHAARVQWGLTEDIQPVISHMVLLVEISGGHYLCDAGFGSFSLLGPLRLRADVEQAIGNDTYRLSETPTGFQLAVKLGEDWHDLYSFDRQAMDDEEILRLNDDIAAGYHARGLLQAGRGDREARRALAGTRLSIYRPGEVPERRHAKTVEELKAMLSDVFRIALPPAAELDPALQRVIEAAGPQEI